MVRPTVGVLALQGCVEPHRLHLEALGLQMREVRSANDLHDLQAMILPGGESGTMLKLMRYFDLEESLAEVLHRIPVWGICAGAILMAKEVLNTSQRSFELIDISIERNAYGRQLESHYSIVEGYPVAYIRAPKIRWVGPGVTIVATDNGLPVWVSEGRRMITTFHSELCPRRPSPMHQQLLQLIEGCNERLLSRWAS